MQNIAMRWGLHHRDPPSRAVRVEPSFRRALEDVVETAASWDLAGLSAEIRPRRCGQHRARPVGALAPYALAAYRCWPDSPEAGDLLAACDKLHLGPTGCAIIAETLAAGISATTRLPAGLPGPRVTALALP
jgi:hypothetical protein